MSLSLVIIAHNEEVEIGACLDSVATNAKGRLSEIIVVDNASTDRTAEIARAHGVRVVSEPRKGTGYARQCGLESASGDLIACLDADTRMPAGWLDIAEKAFAADPALVGLSGPYRYHGCSRLKAWVLAAGWAPVIVGHRLIGTMITGGNFVARRRALEAMGGFDQTIAFYGDDAETARRLATQGKVDFRSDFYVYTSSRRYDAEGILTVAALYLINFASIFLFRRPLNRRHRDIRCTYRPIGATRDRGRLRGDHPDWRRR